MPLRDLPAILGTGLTKKYSRLINSSRRGKQQLYGCYWIHAIVLALIGGLIGYVFGGWLTFVICAGFLLAIFFFGFLNAFLNST